MIVNAELLLLQMKENDVLSDAVFSFHNKQYKIEAFSAKYTKESSEVMRGVTIADLFLLEPPRTAKHLRDRVEHYQLDVQVKMSMVNRFYATLAEL